MRASVRKFFLVEMASISLDFIKDSEVFENAQYKNGNNKINVSRKMIFGILCFPFFLPVVLYLIALDAHIVKKNYICFSMR